MSIAEVARKVREGRMVVLRVSLKGRDRTQMLYLGVPERVRYDTYDVDADDGVLVVRLGEGGRRLVKGRSGVYAFIPKRLVKLEPGPVLAEWLDDRTLLVYLG